MEKQNVLEMTERIKAVTGFYDSLKLPVPKVYLLFLNNQLFSHCNCKYLQWELKTVNKNTVSPSMEHPCMTTSAAIFTKLLM